MAPQTKTMLTVEDHCAKGELGKTVQSALSASATPVHSLAVRQKPRSGNPQGPFDFEEIYAKAIIRNLNL